MNNRPAELIKDIFVKAATGYELTEKTMDEVKTAIAALKLLRAKKQEEITALKEMKNDALKPAIEELEKECSAFDITHLYVHSTPLLFVAAEHGHVALINLLKAEGEGTNFDSEYYGRQFIQACERGRHTLVNSLIECKAPVNISTKHGVTALMYVVNNGMLGTVEKMVNAGADLEATRQIEDGSTQSVLDIAVGNDNFGTIGILLSLGKIINHPDTLLAYIKACKAPYVILETSIAYYDQQLFLREHSDVAPHIERRSEEELKTIQENLGKALVAVRKDPELLKRTHTFNVDDAVLYELLPTVHKDLLPIISDYACTPELLACPQYPRSADDWMRVFSRVKTGNQAEPAAKLENGQAAAPTKSQAS